jgi:hypothetical protein
MLIYLVVAIFFKPYWINSAMIGFMVTLGLNLGTYHKYYHEFKIPKKLMVLIIVSNMLSFLFFLGSNILLDRVWVMISGILLVILAIVTLILIFNYSFQKKLRKEPL